MQVNQEAKRMERLNQRGRKRDRVWCFKNVSIRRWLKESPSLSIGLLGMMGVFMFVSKGLASLTWLEGVIVGLFAILLSLAGRLLQLKHQMNQQWMKPITSNRPNALIEKEE